MTPSSANGHEITSSIPPPEHQDVIARAWEDILGETLAIERASWQRERALIEAQAQASIEQLRTVAVEARATIAEMRALITTRLAELHDGKDGKDGEDGEPGPQGEKGEMGPAGAVGPKGDPGEKAESIAGPPGERGPIGEAGPVGPVGRDGVSIIGPPGNEGPRGLRGEKGDTGVPGAMGERGLPGATGERGEAGIPGMKGDPGIAGAMGERGLSGPTGERGEQGIPGVGEPGKMGERGLPGRDGHSIVGPEGPRGAIGPAGERGDRGDRGEQGIPGLVGKDGAPGPRGGQGDRGEMGPPGRMFPVKHWQPGAIAYANELVMHAGATWQAKRDTSHVPGDDPDWNCVAAAGQDARTPTVRGLWQEAEAYRALDIVASNGGSYIAKRDAPGPCPGDGWLTLVQRGKTGKDGEKGQVGERGPQGAPGVSIRGWEIDRVSYVACPRLSDGTVGPALELRSLFEQFQNEVG